MKTSLTALALAIGAVMGTLRPAEAAEPQADNGKTAGVLVFAPGEGEDCADALQALIDANPNRTILIPDGVHVLSHPVATPADPRRAVSLRLGDFAILRAAPDFPPGEPLLRLGGVHPANDIRTPGSVYSLSGGILDGSGVASGIFVESGRETRIRDVSMKNVAIGLRILRGANSGSSDCDIRDVNIVGNNAFDSVGVLVEAYDNTLTNMRIADCRVGVKLRAGGNLLANIHPLCNNDPAKYDDTIGFDDSTENNSYLRCYADHFSTGWLLRAGARNVLMDGCICYWWASNPGHRHTAIKSEGSFEAKVTGMRIGFRDGQAINTVLDAGAPDGRGFFADPDVHCGLLNNPADAFRAFLRDPVR